MLERGIKELEDVFAKKHQEESKKQSAGKSEADPCDSWQQWLVVQLLERSDDEALVFLRDLAKEAGSDHPALLPLKTLVRGLRYKEVLTRFHSDFKHPNDPTILQKRYSGWEDREMDESEREELQRQAIRNRHLAVRTLEKNFGLRPGTVTMYCPDRLMNAKVNRVKIHFDDIVMPFNKYDGDHRDLLSSGHLKAQEDRFLKLWRIHFFVERKTWDEEFKPHPNRIQLFQDVINHPLLEDDPTLAAKQTRASSLAKRAIDIGVIKLGKGEKYSEKEVVGAREASESGDHRFPGGVPSLLSFIQGPPQRGIAKDGE